MSASEITKTSVTLVRRIDARPDIVFDALSTAEGLTQWMGPDDGPVLLAEVDLRVGGRFRVRFRGLDGREHESSGEFLDIVWPERLAMTWRWLGTEAEGESRIDITLRAIGDSCELRFCHSMLPDLPTTQGHEQGWNGSLDKLVRHLQRLKEA